METQIKTWFITGASQGLGLVLAKQLLNEGYNVVATGRNLESLKAAMDTSSEQLLPLQVDLVNEADVKSGVAAAIAKFKRIDFLVNNAGYGLMGGIEESSNIEVQANFDVNVFGLLNVTRAILAHMRAAKSGHIFNLSSVFGLIAGAGWGIYCATKFAVEGLSEALAQEVKPFNINVTIIEPGYFRTNFLTGGSIVTPKQPISDYTVIAENKHKHEQEISGSQIGDPQKAAEVMINTSRLENPPLRLLLGSDAVQFANYKVELLQAGIQDNLEVSLSTDF